MSALSPASDRLLAKTGRKQTCSSSLASWTRAKAKQEFMGATPKCKQKRIDNRQDIRQAFNFILLPIALVLTARARLKGALLLVFIRG